MEFTSEQRAAIERREGNLLLDAGAGSGKTSVLVERFVRAVVEDGVDVTAILTITFTEKAAAELRERIRLRLREVGAAAAARESENAFISTIHGFCARVLRAGALAAGLDPAFTVLDQPDAERIADAAFDDALEDLIENAPGGLDLVAAYPPGTLRGAIQSLYGELRSRGELAPSLPPLAAAEDDDVELRAALSEAAAGLAEELGGVADPPARVLQALERLERCPAVLAATSPWPGALAAIALPGGNGAALSTPTAQGYSDALNRYRRACEHRKAAQLHALLDRLLRDFGERYSEGKRAVSGLDFEDLELLCRDLVGSHEELRARLRARFAHVMVDELQDTNRVQLELIELIATQNLFTVGDAQQSIYAFRHADVELFERLGEQLEAAGARVGLRTNFRSRPEIVAVINRTFAAALGERFRALVAGRVQAPAEDPCVELIVADKGADWAAEGLASPWRVAEARALARRVADLVSEGVAPREIVVLTRASSDLRVYERALEECGIPTYLIGGRGYWSHPQVLDMLAYLRALANPRDEEALYTVLASPLVGVSYDALVLLAAAARGSGRDPWWVLRDPQGRLDELDAAERERLAEFARWFVAERRVAARAGIEELIERGLALTGYDLAILAMPGGERRLANIRKLMRLGREYEGTAGPDLRGFLATAGRGGGGARESEAPVEGEMLQAVRLMTIHRAKGLEFGVVCVADLGRGPLRRAPLVRVGRDGRFGLRLAQPGTGSRESALDYQALGEEQQRREDEEERRLFYVALTRARERLILSGAAKLEEWPANAGAGPIAWIAPAIVGEGVSVAFVEPGDAPLQPTALTPGRHAQGEWRRPPASSQPPRSVRRLSYTTLAEYERCGYRFYVERALGLPPVDPGDGGETRESGLSGTERGAIAHALLETLDLRRPRVPDAEAVRAAARAHAAPTPSPQEAEDIAALIGAFADSELRARLARGSEVRREQRFAFTLAGGVLMNGAFDVLVREPPNRLLVVDYKTDRLDGVNPAEIVRTQYSTQRLVYGLAGLRAGAESVEVAHMFLAAPEAPASVHYDSGDVEALEVALAERVSGVVQRHFAVTDTPHRAVCRGCPAEGGLCSWPLEMTRREEPDRLF
jgi:ATP-dependent helicase/nuclease subunit A